jgi:ComEC/Rec2-related protein
MLARRPGLTIAVAFIVGILAVRFLPGSQEYMGYLCVAAIVIAAALFFAKPKPSVLPPMPDGYSEAILPRPGWLARRGLGIFILALAVAALFFGMARQALWQDGLDAARESIPGKYYFNATLLALTPSKQHENEEGEWKIQALMLLADGKSVSIPVRLTGRRGAEFRRGDILETRLRKFWNQPKAFPGAFDYFAWLERNGLAESFSVALPRAGQEQRDLYRVVRIDSPPVMTLVRRGIDRIRSKATSLTIDYGGEDMGPMLAAMIYGYRDEMEPAARDAFRRVGIGHVLAISGLHVGLVIWLLWWLSGWLAIGPGTRVAACLVLALVYLGLSGGQVAAFRATIMAVVHLTGKLLGRKSDMLNSLGIAALIICLLNPSAPTDISFQLSFAAVVFIYIAVNRTSPELQALAWKRKTTRNRINKDEKARSQPWLGRFWYGLDSLFRISAATSIGLFPIIMAVFHQINLIGLVVNIVAVPLMSFVLAGGLLLPCLGWIPGVAWLLTLPGEILWFIALKADKVPYSSLPAHAPDMVWLALFYALFVAYMFVRRIRKAKVRRACLASTAIALVVATVGIIASAASLPPPEGGRISVLPARGMGAVVVEDADGNIAVVGNLSREGLREAYWLHYLKRGHKVNVLAFSARRKAANYPALDYHNGIASFHAIGTKKEEGRFPLPSGRWRQLGDLKDTEIAVSRNKNGRIVWLAVKTPDGMLCLTDRLSAMQLDLRLGRNAPGLAADLFIFSLNRDEENKKELPRNGILARYGGGKLGEGMIDRGFFGVMLVENKQVQAYNGHEWLFLDKGR